MSLKQLLTNVFGKKKSEEPPIAEVAPTPPKSPKIKAGRTLPAKAQALLDNPDSFKGIKANDTKLNEDQQMELMEMIARFWNTPKIISEIYSRHQIQISPNLISQYKHTKKWIPVIKKLREKYVTGIDEVAGMHKRVRLERAEEVYSKAIKDGKLRLALAANKDQREEVFEKQAGGNVTYNLNQFNQYVNMTDEELEEKKHEILTKIKKAEVTTDGGK